MDRARDIDDRSRMLRHALIGNAIFSGISGTAFILASGHVAALTGLPSELPLQLVGIGLLPFAALLVWLAERPALSQNEGRMISLMDAQWVLGTFVLLIGWPELLNDLGQLLAIGIAAVVLGFAVWQWIGTRQLATPA